jgi:hypothetical protein
MAFVPGLGGMVGKLRCRSACSSFPVLLQFGQTPQLSCSFLFSQKIYCANASPKASPPVPSAPLISSACGNRFLCHIFNKPSLAAGCPTTSVKCITSKNKQKSGSLSERSNCPKYFRIHITDLKKNIPEIWNFKF